MKRHHRPIALLAGAAALFLALLLAPRSSPPPLPEAGKGSAAPHADATPSPPPDPPPPAPSNPALSKEAERTLARTKSLITAAGAGADGPARFVLRDRNVSAFFTPSGVSLALLGRMDGKRPDSCRMSWAMNWGITGAARTEPRAEGEQASKVHVLKGAPEEWRTDQKTYSRIVYDDVKPGVDMIVESATHGLKYTLVADKASDVAALRLRYEGASALRAVDGAKALEIAAGEGRIREDGLIVTQEGRPIEASYEVTGTDEYRIVLEGADPDRPLEVDPLIGWSTYLGGTLGSGGGSDYGYCIEVDGSGNMYVAGYTYSGDFPTTVGVYDRIMGGSQDGFVAKISAAGGIVWSTYLGGSSYDQIYSLAIDAVAPNPNVYVTGSTDSADFPVTSGVIDSSYNNGEAFVAKISGSGAGLAWATFLGGSSSEYGQRIKVDGAGNNIWVAGYTYSTDFPTSGGFDSTASTLPDGFVCKMNGLGTLFAWSSYLGGSSSDYVLGMAVDSAGAVLVTGYTYSTDFPVTAGTFDTSHNGSADVFVTKIKPAGTAIDWSTFLGGTSTDIGLDIALDASATPNPFVTGYTYSSTFPVLSGVDTTYNGNADAFLSKLSGSSGALIFSSFLGGTDSDYGQAVRVDSAGQGVVSGYSYSSTSFPIGANPLFSPTYDTTHNGGADIFVTKFQPAGNLLWWSTWIGGSDYEYPYALAIDASDNLYLTGATYSLPGSFPLVSPFDNTLGGGQDAFVMRLASTGMTLGFSSYLGGDNAVGDDYGRKVAVDASGNVYVTGVTYASNFPTTGGVIQAGPNGSSDTTVTKYSNAAAPVLLWSTYLGGSSSDDPTAIGVDPNSGAVYVAGVTYSSNFPTTMLPLISSTPDGFVSKLNATGTAFVWSRFLGGNSSDYPQSLSVNAAGDVALAGYTFSTNFPVSAGAFRTTASTGGDAFATRLSAAGGVVTWSTYYAGSDTDYALGVSFDSTGAEIYIGGYTYSTNLPTTGGVIQPFWAGGSDLFAARFNPALSGAAQLLMGTYYGGVDYEYAVDMALGPGDNIFLLGQTSYSTFPRTTGPLYSGSDDAVLAKIRNDGALFWSRYLGGSSTDIPTQIRVDSLGSPVVTGYTYSIDFPIQGAFQANLAGNADAFVTKLDLSGSTLDWSSFLGGTNSDYPYGLALGSGGTTYVIGETYSPDFPKLNANDGSFNGAEFFITRIDNSNPSVPSGLSQFKLNGSTGLAVGAWSNESGFVVKATLGDLDDDAVGVDVEVQPIDAAFTGAVTASSTLGASGTQRSVTVGFPATATRQFHWRARAFDVHGRTSAWVVFGGNSDGAPPGTPAARDVGQDVGNPTAATSTPTTGSSYTTAVSPISFTGTAADALSGIASVTWSNSLGGSGTATGTTSWSVPSIPLSAASGGVNVITFTATDLAGNTGTKVVTVTYDTTAPVNVINSPTSSATYLTGTGTSPSSPPTGIITLGGSVNEANTLSAVTWSNLSGGNGSASISGSAPNWTWSADITLTPGSNQITVTAFDGANNFHADTITVTYDNVPPAVNITTGPPYTTANATFDLDGSASDANTVASVTWVNDRGGSGSSLLTPAPPSPQSWSISGIPLLGGANLITVTANDGVPNARSNLNSASTSLTLFRDVAAPVVTISNPPLSGSPPGFVTGNNSITVSGSATDDLEVVSVAWINPTAGINTPQPATLIGPLTSRSWSANVTLTGGNNLITFTATDRVGQTHSTQTYITQSTAAPSLTVAVPATSTGVTSATPFAISGTAAANSPATSITSVTVENLTTSVLVVATGTTSWSANIALVIGTNDVEVVATDNLGLTTTVTRTIILDPSAPAVTITGPTGSDAFATSSNSVTLAGVASDNRGVQSVVWSNTTTGTLNQNATLDGPPASATWSTAPISLAAGANTIVVRATDEAGNFSEDSIVVTQDTATPGVTITSPTSAPTATTLLLSVSLGGTASDDVGLQVVTWLNAATGASGSASGTTSWSTPAINLNLGANPITVIAVDRAGNTQTDTILVHRDGALPAVTITSPTPDPTFSTATATVSLGGTASDDVQVATVSWSRSPGPLTGGATGTTTWSISSIPLVAGNNTITVTATDGAGQSTNDQIVVSYDPTAPTVAIVTPATDPFSTTTTPLSLSGTAGDNISVVEVNWTNLTTGGSGSASGTTSWNCLAPLTSGSNVLQVTAVDAAGNSATDSITVVYDPAAPMIDITSPTTGLSIATSTTPILVAGTASDDVGVASVTWSTSGAVAVTSGTATGTDAWSFSVELAPGENVITVTATDGVSRTGTAFLTIVYDPTDPQVTVTLPTTDPVFLTTQGTANISGIANDNLSLQSVTWSNLATGAGGPTLGVGAWSIDAAALNEGSNLFTITATDSVNNSGSAQIDVIYDGTDPLVAINPPAPPDVNPGGPPYTTSVRPFPISGTASDNLGLAGVAWTNSRGGGGAAVVAAGTWSASVYLLSGTNVITVTATDNHGRTSTAVLSVDFTPEGTAPTIDILSPAPPTANSAAQVVALSGTATDNVGVVGVTWHNQTTRIRGDVVPTGPGTPPDFATWTAGVPLIAGPNVIVVTAVDDAGNTASASITVTYTPAAVDTTAPIITITAPTNLDLYTATASPLDVGVTATDDDGIAGVYWSNSGTGGDGTATPDAGDDWVMTVPLALGTNLVTITAVDASGNTATDTLIVTFTPAAPDGVSPTITIMTPPTGTTYNTSVGQVTVTGTSSDDTAVATVVYLNGATLLTGSAEGTIAWTSDVQLQPGINVLTLRVYDTSGNTDTDQITVLYTPPPPPPEVVPAGSCGLTGLEALALLAAAALWRRRRRR